jgi:VanZ family protein
MPRQLIREALSVAMQCVILMHYVFQRESGMKEWIWRWGPAVLFMIIIFSASATPGSDLPEFGVWDLLVKKGGHMLGYAILAAAYFHGLNNGRNLTRSQYAAAVGLTVLYAATDEFHQRFTPGRSPSVYDVLIDAVGAGLGLALWCKVKTYFSRRQKANG